MVDFSLTDLELKEYVKEVASEIAVKFSKRGVTEEEIVGMMMAAVDESIDCYLEEALEECLFDCADTVDEELCDRHGDPYDDEVEED